MTLSVADENMVEHEGSVEFAIFAWVHAFIVFKSCIQHSKVDLNKIKTPPFRRAYHICFHFLIAHAQFTFKTKDLTR